MWGIFISRGVELPAVRGGDCFPCVPGLRLPPTLQQLDNIDIIIIHMYNMYIYIHIYIYIAVNITTNIDC